MSLAQHLQEEIAAQSLFEIGEDRLVLGISGGLDSMVLAHLLMSWAQPQVWVHFNYQLRATAQEEADFLAQLAQEKDIPFYTKTYDLGQELAQQGGNLQARARSLRYQYFEEVRQQVGAKYILTAHHLDDLLETFFLQQLRGGGLGSMQGILPKDEQRKLCRPLLSAPKSALKSYALAQNIVWKEDQSNQEVKYKRNFLRNRVLPEIQRAYPNYKERLAQNIGLLREENRFIQKEMQAYRQRLLAPGKNGELARLSWKNLAQCSEPALFLQYWLRPLGFAPKQIQNIWSKRQQQAGGLHLAPNYRLQEMAWGLVLGPAEQPPLAALALPIPEMGQEIRLELGQGQTLGLYWAQKGEGLLPEQLTKGLFLRQQQAGDRFRPLGMGGQSKKLSKYYKDEGLSQFEREAQYVLAQDKAILAVLGRRLGQQFKQADGPNRLCLELLKKA
ncbi:tRNA(Ile)-lysidine synthetase [Saprospira grandis DSM 2844]|uniref:tRNA(Ile)-lysidine synthase n=1 Tax=Saprospira grandis DSM 2844 TaxID=694433 RepID=J0P9H3_9BACT|nr:tRNA lysidine(34) synthetase TilS [Saprospira grandis]EJF54242.1 tRNA(Ile)-lysidine synthetase [Saprospira grandis DSM 2844]